MQQNPGHDDRDESLAPDDLGEAGESLFRNLCARSRLFCNKSDRDRAGWDFVVDFPMDEPGTGALLDQRQKTRCNVQLKSSAAVGNGTVSLKLSAADLLAKDALPAFIIVFRLRRNGEPLKGYLIHLLGDPLAKILRRLREAEARGRHDIQNLKITFDYRKYGYPFDLTPAGLRGALEHACGSDPAAYARAKLHQLEMLGYDQGHLIGNVLFQVDSDDHLSRILLGVEPLKPARFEAFDTRFGIPIACDDALFAELEEIMLQPPSAGGCTIAISGPPLAPAATFGAELLFAPPFDGSLRMLIRHPDITFTFRESAIAFEADGVFSDRARSLDDMVMLLRGLAYLATGKAVISLTGEGGSFGPIRAPIATPLTGPYLDQLPALAELASDFRKLLDLAGIRSHAAFTMDDLWEAHRVSLAADLIIHATPVAAFAFDSADLPEVPDSVTAIYFDSCEIAGEGVSYSVEVTLERSLTRPGVYRSVSFKPIEVIPRVADLNEYMDELAERFSHQIMIHPDNVRRVDPKLLEEPAAPRLA